MPVFDKNKIFDKIKTEKSLNSIEWGTPHEIYEPLNKEFNFTLDVCANETNKKCERFYNKQDNGLSKKWDNEICWCNPPYGREVKEWCKKALKQTEKNTTTVLLIPCKTNTGWWHDYVIPFAEIRFLRGRVKFLDAKNNQSKQALPWPLAIVIYRAGGNVTQQTLCGSDAKASTPKITL